MDEPKIKMADNIRAKIKSLEDDMRALEMSDDCLFTNRNGNLPRYNAMGDEISRLTSILKEHYSEH